jgi:CheY-like chemotaxis protein
MNILIIEDDNEKAEDIAKFVSEIFDLVNVSFARSLQSGVKSVLNERFDLLLLDMTMTNFDRSPEDGGGRPHHFAGREILRQMKREAVRIPVIVITNFDRFGDEPEEVTLQELKRELEDRFPDYIGTVYYRSNVDEWKQELLMFISAFQKDNNNG